MQDVDQFTHVEAYDASFGTQGDYAAGTHAIDGRMIARAAAVGINADEIVVDGKGRMIFDPLSQPIELAAYRPELEDKSPEQMAVILAAADCDKNANNYAHLMQQPPAPIRHSGGRSLKFKRRKKGSGSGSVGAPTIERETRTTSAGGRVSESTKRALLEIEKKTGVNVAGLLAAIGALHDDGSFSARLALNKILRAVPGHQEEIERAS